jgi:citrate synthase
MKSANESDEILKVSGLDHISFAETKLSLVNGEEGRLLIGGYPVEELATQTSFEAVCHLLLRGRLPSQLELAKIREQLGEQRAHAFHLLRLNIKTMKNLSSTDGFKASTANGMDFLRASLAAINVEDKGDVAALTLIAATAVASAAWNRLRLGYEPISPDPSLTHAEDFLRMATAIMPDSRLAGALNSYLVTVSDHGMNASTFAARVIASTGSDLVSSIVGAVGALKGPLHGGAPGPVLNMLEEIGAPENAESWLDRELQAGRRIMGMGHRIYRVRDPRAEVLEKAIVRLEKAGIKSRNLALARAVENAATTLLAKRYPERPLKSNVEFYTAVILDAVGLPWELFSPTFACGRVLGWCAHIDEQRKFGRLVRPQSTYVGPILQLDRGN